MDRKTFMDLHYNKTQQSSIEDIDNLIVEWCVEAGKEEYQSRVFVEVLKRQWLIYSSIYSFVLEYYKRKFNICTLRSKDGTILQIF